MIRDYLRALGAALEDRGVLGRARRRVLAETEDHLRAAAAEHGEEEAVARFGDSRSLAVEIGAQLATTRTIRSTYATFGVLALVGLGYVAVLGYAGDGGRADLFAGEHAAVGVLASLGLGLFPQIALVAGGLALTRAVRRRTRGVVSCEELDVMRRRSAVALGAGALTLASMAVWAWEFDGSGLVAALALAALVPLGVTTAGVVRASGTQALTGGPAEDVFDDLGLQRVRPHPWFFALVVSSGAGAAAFAVDGVALATLQFAAVLVCFAALGRPLALRK